MTHPYKLVDLWCILLVKLWCSNFFRKCQSNFFNEIWGQVRNRPNFPLSPINTAVLLYIFLCPEWPPCLIYQLDPKSPECPIFQSPKNLVQVRISVEAFPQDLIYRGNLVSSSGIAQETFLSSPQHMYGTLTACRQDCLYRCPFFMFSSLGLTEF